MKAIVRRLLGSTGFGSETTNHKIRHHAQIDNNLKNMQINLEMMMTIRTIEDLLEFKVS